MSLCDTMTAGTFLQGCPLCEAACGLEITVDAGRATRVRGDQSDPSSAGFLCPKGASIIGLHDDPDRLRMPLVRRGGQLREVSWDEAFAEAARRIPAFLEEHGREAFATYTGNPSAYNLSLLLYGPHLVRAVGSRKHFSSGSVDILPKQLACALMYGHSYSIPVPDIDQSRYLLVLGANPIVSNGSTVTAPNMPERLKKLRERGGRLVVVDPRRTKTAEAADEHVAIRPGTDAWLLASMANVILSRGMADLGAQAGHVAGLEQLRAHLEPFTPELAEQWTGIAAADVVRLAEELATTRPAVVYGRVGTCLQEHGTMASWLIEVLNVITGNLDRPGGAVFTSAVTERARHRDNLASQEHAFGRFRSRVRGLPEAFGELPAVTLAEDILEPGPGRIRGLLVLAGNPALSIPGSNQTEAALGRLDLLICVDSYLNETTRHADIVFPADSPLERPAFPFIARWSVRRVARWTTPLLEADGHPAEWETLLQLVALFSGDRERIDSGARHRDLLARRIEREVGDPRSAIAGRDPAEIAALTQGADGPEQMMDFLLRVGQDGDGYGSRPGGLSLELLRERPHGIDLGVSAPLTPGVIATSSGQVELTPTLLVDELDRLAAQPIAPDDPGRPLRLIGRRNLRSNNSWMHNVRSLVRGRPQCTLMMHPDDAARFDVADGSRVRVESSTGCVEVDAEVTDAMRPGVVSLPHGWGHDRPGTRLLVAATVAGANSNALGDSNTIDVVSGTAAANGISVAVSPVHP
jgi:anaerobic selenocysteine-containing dehydrogenase